MARGEDVRACAPRALRARDHQPPSPIAGDPVGVRWPLPRLADLAGRAPDCIEIPGSPDAVAWGLARVSRRVAYRQRTRSVPCAFNPERRIRRNARNHDHDFGYHFHSDADKRYGVRYHGVAFGRGAGQWDDARCRTQEECAQPGSWTDSVRSKLRRMRFNGRTINKSTGSPTSK